MTLDILDILSNTHPYDSLSHDDRVALAETVSVRTADQGSLIQQIGLPQDALFLIFEGQVEILDSTDTIVSILGPKNSFGERGLMRDGNAATTVRTNMTTTLLSIPADVFSALVAAHPSVARFFDRTGPAQTKRQDLTTLTLSEMMTPNPFHCPPDTSLRQAAQTMRDHRISCLMVLDGQVIKGIVTTRDLTNKALAAGLSHDTPISAIMTPDPISLPPSALVSDVLHTMMEQGISHMPVVQDGLLSGIITQTDLTRYQAVSSAAMIQQIAYAPDAGSLPAIVRRIPQLLVQLVGAHNAHQVVTRLITDIGDATTRRLLKLAEQTLGPPPVPYLWVACGSQGRQEQTGVSDQDNCLILDDRLLPEHDAYFRDLTKFVSDGLDACGYFYCPGDMMATNDRWRQPLRVWKEYFIGWISRPDPMAQMLASVMFDLRPIGGDASLFTDLQKTTLDMAASNSIFVAHMISNSLKHMPPLGLFRGFVTVRSSENKNTIDLKHNGVVPVVDLGRVYALQGRLTDVNTRARLTGAINAGQISASGGRDLIAAYDMIADTRLMHQATLIKRSEAPDNFMAPTDLSDFERSHLRDAFVVIKTMQSAVSQGRGILS